MHNRPLSSASDAVTSPLSSPGASHVLSATTSKSHAAGGGLAPPLQEGDDRALPREMLAFSDCEPPPATLDLRIRVLRLFILSVLAVTAIVVLMSKCYEGFTLTRFRAVALDDAARSDLLDDYNSYVGNVAAAFAKPLEMLLAMVVPVLLLSVASRAVLRTEPTRTTELLSFGVSSLLGYLLANGFNAINVQLQVREIEAVVSRSDLALQQTKLLAALAQSSNVSRVVPEAQAGNPLTNTVLRGVLGPPLGKPRLQCGNVLISDSTNSISSSSGGDDGGGNRAESVDTAVIATRVVVSYGFPLHAWQDAMVSTAPPEQSFAFSAKGETLAPSVGTTTFAGDSSGESDASTALATEAATDTEEEEVVPMPLHLAANLLLHGVHFTRHLFHWFDAASEPLGVLRALRERFEEQTDTHNGGERVLVDVAELMELVPAGSRSNFQAESKSTPTTRQLQRDSPTSYRANSDTKTETETETEEETEKEPEEEAKAESNSSDQAAFVARASTLLRESLSGAANVSPEDAALEFTHVALAPNVTFDAVTIDMPLATSALTRQLVWNEATKALEETEKPDKDKDEDVYYDVDIAHDCGPYAGECVLRAAEFDVDGKPFKPVPTVKALATCLSERGDEALEVSYTAQDTRARYSCRGVSATSMLVVSVASRITGDAFLEGPRTLPNGRELREGMATIRNPRKIYSLTVGRLGWGFVDLAAAYNASCGMADGDEADGGVKCHGLAFALSEALSSSTWEDPEGKPTNGRDGLATGEYHLIVGRDFLPSDQLSTFNYNDTERALALPRGSVTENEGDDHEPSVVEWMPLVMIAEPQVEVTTLATDGDLLLPHGFDEMGWQADRVRRGAECSATAESRMNHLVNRHLYAERGLQPAYTSALFFLFQNAVSKDVLQLADGRTTLRFNQNVEWIDAVASVPIQNVALTIAGCALLLLAAMALALQSVWQRCCCLRASHKRRAAQRGRAVSPDVIAKVMLDGDNFPPMLLQRRLVAVDDADDRGNARASLMDHFAIGGLQLHRQRDEDTDPSAIDLVTAM